VSCPNITRNDGKMNITYKNDDDELKATELNKESINTPEIQNVFMYWPTFSCGVGSAMNMLRRF
jgi:hypothetical protein